MSPDPHIPTSSNPYILTSSNPYILTSSNPYILTSLDPHIQKILLIRLREIGDVVFTTPAIRAIRRQFPSAHLTYIVEPGAAPVVANNPHVNEVIVAPRRRGVAGIWPEVTLVRRLRSARFDLAIDFHGGPRASLLSWLSGAPHRIGYQVTGRAWMYTTRVARPRALRARHSVQNQWDLLGALGIAPPDPGRDPVEMPADPRMTAEVAARLTRASVRDTDLLIVMHVSAGNPFRRWPIGSFATVAATLVQADPRHRIVVTSGPSEREAAARVIAAAKAALGPDDQPRVLMCGEFSLAELRALADRAALYIGGDSGPLHIASTTVVPIVGLYGPTLPARSAPWRSGALPAESVEVGELPCRPCDQRTCEPGDFRCLTRIEPQQVIDAARRALGHPHSKM
jgi:lipopolysaccharide heptosyltransferase II